MRKPLALSLATFVLSMTGLLAVGAAHAEPCLTEEPVGLAGRQVSVGDETLNVPGVRIQFCASPHGSAMNPAEWAAPRIEPGSCEPSVYDPLCFTLYVDSKNVPHWTSFTVHIKFDGGYLPTDAMTIGGNIPPIPQPTTICVLSIGHTAAPTHDCQRWVDIED